MKLSGTFERMAGNTALRLAPLVLLAIAPLARADWTLVRAEPSGAPVTTIHAASLYTAQAGQRFAQDDIVETPPDSAIQLQDGNGNLLAFGPGTRAMLTRDAHVALLRGWLKLVRACTGNGAGCAAPVVETADTRIVPANDTALVIASAPGSGGVDAVFCERGAAQVVALGAPHGKSSVIHIDAQGAAYASHPRQGATLPLSRGPDPAFVAAMPVGFRDALRPLPMPAATHGTPARGLRPVAYADVADWLDSALAVRTDPATRFAARFRSRLSDPAFRAEVKQHVDALPDWRVLVFPPPRPLLKPAVKPNVKPVVEPIFKPISVYPSLSGHP
ncbi:hypothetical protein AB4851_15110 [Burkholderia sp. 22PA0099]|uniref:hypothetical protein n=1 Tax=Burkholderia sp. 22PA0099 TaxID=3237372 RepID=UPI0039C288CB